MGRVTGQPGWPGGFDPSALGQVFGQLQRIFSGPADEGPVNWALAREVALEALAESQGSGGAVATTGPRVGFGAPGPSAGAGGEVPARAAEEILAAARTADLWLDEVTQFPAAGGRCEAWTSRDWVERTLPTWRTLVAPVAERMAQSVTSGLAPGETLPPGLPPEAAGLVAQAGPMFARLGGGLLGIQLGQALAAMAQEVVGAFDAGFPLAGSTSALLPASVRATAEQTGLDETEARLFLALREQAHARLFAAAPWLSATLLAGIEGYAAGIDIDADRIRETLSGLDPRDPGSLQEALTSGILEPATTETQRAALARLELLLALVEGWVETVVTEAAAGHVPHAQALLEYQRRRRAVGGPAERTFGALVGLELRPRRMREAAAWWSGHPGPAERDAVWSHPDLLPDDLSDTAGTDATPGEGGTDLDAELRDLLDGATATGEESRDPDAADGSPGGSGPDDSPGGPAPQP